jgi:anti-sigma regulatory factor (Ser/Thr protein kinase)
MLDQLESLLIDEKIPKDTVGEVRLIAEEALSNIIQYAYKSGEERFIEVIVSYDKAEVTLETRDDGQAFNPLEVPPPNLDEPIEARDMGGLGIHLMTSLADETSYARRGPTNILVLKKRV